MFDVHNIDTFEKKFKNQRNFFCFHHRMTLQRYDKKSRYMLFLQKNSRLSDFFHKTHQSPSVALVRIGFR